MNDGVNIINEASRQYMTNSIFQAETLLNLRFAWFSPLMIKEFSVHIKAKRGDIEAREYEKKRRIIHLLVIQ